MKKDMNTIRQIRTLLIMLALIMGAANGAWALSTTDIKIDESITHGSVRITSVDDATRTVTITVTPASGYYVNKSDIIVQKLLDPSNASTRSNTPDIAETLAVSGPSSSSEEADYTFVVPADYAGALVTVKFTGMDPATATVTPNSLTYTGEEQELVTLENVVGGAATDPVTYSLVGVSGPYSSAIPTATNAGTYTVYYKVAGDASHAEGSGSVNVTINKAQITSVELESNAINYNGAPHTVRVTSAKAGTIDVPSTDYTYSGNTATDVGTYTVTVTAKTESTNFTGSATASFRIVEQTITIINSSTEASAVTDLTGHYLLMSNINASVLARLVVTTADFTGTFEAGSDNDGNLFKINMSGYNHALFTTINGGTVKNVILDYVNISEGTTFEVDEEDKVATGAIANVATGATRIYNCGVLASNSTVTIDKNGYTQITSCSSSVSGSDYVGGLVGYLDGEARVINCFSYANVSGGSYVGGIVGYNNVENSASNNLKTMVMNCMFYGEVSGTSIAPIYNGNIITNDGSRNGVGNYNYFRLEASYVQPTGITYNCALGAEDRYLQRFEFFRNLLNSHRELAGWWATGTYSSSEMMKWVLEPSQLGTSTPYPILKVQGKYPSVVNIDAENAPLALERNKGGKLGTLSVTISGTGGGAVYSAPDGAEISTGSLILNITDKDPDHFNFNYYKVQLPYYNDVGIGNYTGNRVVTGWKIVRITGGTSGSYITGEDATADTNGNITATPYNFADRNCTDKDLYSVSGRIFNQGAYWDVPEGVTAITIEPYWAKCVYLADQNADKVYNQGMTTGYDVPNVGGGKIYTNGNSYSIAGENQVVYTAIGNAIASDALFAGYTDEQRNNQSVYDYAVVLVGNYHHYYPENKIEASKSKPYTVTSIDLDGDNEPDYSYILRYDKRSETHPVRADFINIPGLGMAQKSTGGTGSYNFGIMIPKGWFESTNTSLFRFTQFEYEHSSRSETDAIIVQGGVIEQWVSNNQKGTSNKIPYIHVGGNVWFKEFQTGCHQDKQIATKHSPISVTGGDYDEFYLTGLYRGDVTSKGDNAECYINGGRFGIVCGAAMEGIGNAGGASNTGSTEPTGNITWQIQNADIDEFYAGGINAASGRIVEGNLTTVIEGGYIKLFCGGPKFGDMNSGKTVNTTANGTIFDTFFGAGYGGNSYSRQAPRNHNNIVNFPHNDAEGAGNNSSWNDWLDDHYLQEYNANYGGVSTQFSYQFLPMSNNGNNVARIFVDYVKFSLATTHGVTSTLKDCTITGNFYGGGSLGKVNGNVTSTLDGCTVKGNVFGAGYSASLPDVVVDAIGFEVEPYYYENLGTYRTGVKYKVNSTYEPKTYTWIQGAANSLVSIDKENHTLSTPEDLSTSNLGSVAGNVNLTIKGNSVIGTVGDANTGNVYGGGEMSYVVTNSNITNQKVIVNLEGNTEVRGNVYGGGDEGEVQCSTEVNIRQ